MKFLQKMALDCGGSTPLLSTKSTGEGLDALLPMRRNDAHRGRVRRYSRARHRRAAKAAYDRPRALEGAALMFRDESSPATCSTRRSKVWPECAGKAQHLYARVRSATTDG
jgi:hypothetical protein